MSSAEPSTNPPAPPTPDSAQAKDSGPKPRRETIPHYVIRLVLILVVIGMSVYTLHSFWRLLEGPKPAPRPTVAPLAGFPRPEFMPALVPDGHWNFADQPYQVQIVQGLRNEELTERLRRPPPLSTLNTKATPEERSLLSMATSKARVVEQKDDDKTYVYEQPDLRAVLFTRMHQGEERVLAGRLAAADRQGGWTMLEALPGGKKETGLTAGSAPILPLPAGTEFLASRRGDGAELIAQLISTNASRDQLRQLWVQDGWSVEMFPGGKGADAPLLCTRGRDTVQVWRYGNEAGGARATLFIVRLPQHDPTKR
jgi:hypothetical protein